MVYLIADVIQIRANTWASARKILISSIVIVVQRDTLEPCATSVSLLLYY